MYAIGIDLGTTNTVVSVFRNGRKETLKLDGGSNIPSVVSFKKNQPVLVGRQAKARLGVAPDSTVGSAKRFMGDQAKTYQINGSSYSPVDISAHILKYAIEGAKDALGQDVWDAVITVPAYFNDAQRADTRRAGEQAGLNVLRLLPEPSAAAISYGFDKDKDQTILVYDLGGGTFDISVLRVAGNDFEVLGVGGDSQLGGDDFDIAILEWVAEEFKQQYGIDLLDTSNRENAIARQRIKEVVEQAKIDLSEPGCDTAEIIIPEILGHSLDLELDIEQFNKLINSQLRRTIDSIHQVLRETKLSADDIDRVVLIGGSTRIRAVKAMVTEEIREPYCDENPEEAVAWGASIIAASLGTPDEDLTPDIILKEVTAHSLGIGMIGEGSKYIFQPIISKNSKYPCQGGVIGFTTDPFQQAVGVCVFRGENSAANDNDELGDLTVPVKQPHGEQVPVVAVFRLDDDGILHFQAVDIPISVIQEATVVSFLENAYANGGTIDVGMLEKLISENKIPQPEMITIDPTQA